jgi:hypothetical protein
MHNAIFILSGLCMLLFIGGAILLYEIHRFNKQPKIKLDLELTMKFMRTQIETCKTEKQLNMMRDFYRMIISKRWLPHLSQKDIDDTRLRLRQIAFYQEDKILTKR